MIEQNHRRAFLSLAGASVVAAACGNGARDPSSPAATTSSTSKKDDDEDVSATEDLMREHGVIRRVLVVYREVALQLRTKPASVASEALQKAASLIRNFGEEYHEKQLEEGHIFPALLRKNVLVDTVQTLIAQHQRGREITEYILATTQKPVGVAIAEPLAHTLDAFARMYEEHAAMEDTIIFPAWKKILSRKELDEMGDRFEDIEHKTFGKDGFEDAVKQIAAIENTLGITLAGLLPAPPPKV